MFKYKVIAFAFLMATIMSSQGYSQEASKDQQIETIAGVVTKIDVEGGAMEIKTDHGVIECYLAAESDLLRFSHHIASIEILKGDPVIIQYKNTLGKNNIVTLVDNKPASY